MEKITIKIPNNFVTNIQKYYPKATNKQIAQVVEYYLEEKDNFDPFEIDIFLGEDYSDERLLEIFGEFSIKKQKYRGDIIYKYNKNGST